VNAADLPARVIPADGRGRRSFILSSQAEADAAVERVGWVTIHAKSDPGCGRTANPADGFCPVHGRVCHEDEQ
jgi:hypothetical protein